MKIAIDAMGGDFAPQAVIEGTLLASEELPSDVKLILIGKEQVIQELLHTPTLASNNIEIIHAEEVVEMGEHPTKALTQKTKSSIAIGYGMLKAGQVNAFCSAGNTGAMHVGAMFSIKAIEGVMRPCLSSHVPKEDGSYGVILDIGANAECKPDVLEQFAVIGSIYAKHILGIKNPRVGLMNIGEEEQKGTQILQSTHQLLKANSKINFIGNIEGRDVYSDKADVIVCDGYTGNVILKMAESVYDVMHKRGLEDEFFAKFNYEAIGGSPILGVNGNVVIGHGVSSPLAIKNMILLAKKMAESNIYLNIKQALSS
ncbi:phosphate acyltransferase PlsX [Rhodocytophaga aerolata]|uniref:Phosphate acyltransferase n=1 Tax=Rhodocytophaga aerolata TaxID=455078 RepID=A0ABT8RHD2_9BACT|nr:phosphate acyltransferase PlsX [Rhodocytophaga aerolata]MDO1450102.1 phosphate acyltransferase PlsX [Rhodocytophaga aerolata]